MFRFHETTRKRVCRTAFAMLCIMPTLATLTWIGWRCRPSLAADQSAQLSSALHVDARLADWREPRPGLYRTDRLSLLHPGADAALVNLENLEVQRGNGALRIEAGAVSLDASSLDAFAQLAMTWLALRESTSMTFTAKDLAFLRSSAKDALVLHDLQIHVEAAANGTRKTQLSATFGNDATQVKAVTVALERTRDGIIATLDLGAVELPCRLVASAIPALAGLNDEALYSGVVQIESRDGGLYGTARGRIAGLALQRMLPSGSPHVAGGSATVSQMELKWQGRRIESIAASVRADNIEVSASLVDAAVRSLYCTLANTQVASDFIAVDRFACRFQFDRRGLTLTGELGAESNVPPGCIASSQVRMQLMQPQYVDLPLAAWVQFVAAPASSWFPATQEAVEIGERLPLPMR
jgi:hypothetical protein